MWLFSKWNQASFRLHWTFFNMCVCVSVCLFATRILDRDPDIIIHNTHAHHRISTAFWSFPHIPKNVHHNFSIVFHQNDLWKIYVFSLISITMPLKPLSVRDYAFVTIQYNLKFYYIVILVSIPRSAARLRFRPVCIVVLRGSERLAWFCSPKTCSIQFDCDLSVTRMN